MYDFVKKKKKKNIFLHVAGGEHHGFPRILQERRRETEIKREVGKERGGGVGKRETEERERSYSILKKAHNVSLFPGKFFNSKIRYT